jgi:hypothetical protein
MVVSRSDEIYVAQFNVGGIRGMSVSNILDESSAMLGLAPPQSVRPIVSNSSVLPTIACDSKSCWPCGNVSLCKTVGDGDCGDQ